MKVEITKAQLEAIIDLVDDIDAMIGCGDFDHIWKKNVKLADRFLKKNGMKRQYKSDE